MKRTLTLRREPLAELTAEELGGVVAASITGIDCRLMEKYGISEPSSCYDCVTRACW
jgi:hypothetical protein